MKQNKMEEVRVERLVDVLRKDAQSIFMLPGISSIFRFTCKKSLTIEEYTGRSRQWEPVWSDATKCKEGHNVLGVRAKGTVIFVTLQGDEGLVAFYVSYRDGDFAAREAPTPIVQDGETAIFLSDDVLGTLYFLIRKDDGEENVFMQRSGETDFEKCANSYPLTNIVMEHDSLIGYFGSAPSNSSILLIRRLLPGLASDCALAIPGNVRPQTWLNHDSMVLCSDATARQLIVLHTRSNSNKHLSITGLPKYETWPGTVRASWDKKTKTVHFVLVTGKSKDPEFNIFIGSFIEDGKAKDGEKLCRRGTVEDLMKDGVKEEIENTAVERASNIEDSDQLALENEDISTDFSDRLYESSVTDSKDEDVEVNKNEQDLDVATTPTTEIESEENEDKVAEELNEKKVSFKPTPKPRLSLSMAAGCHNSMAQSVPGVEEEKKVSLTIMTEEKPVCQRSVAIVAKKEVPDEVLNELREFRAEVTGILREISSGLRELTEVMKNRAYGHEYQRF